MSSNRLYIETFVEGEGGRVGGGGRKGGEELKRGEGFVLDCRYQKWVRFCLAGSQVLMCDISTLIHVCCTFIVTRESFSVGWLRHTARVVFVPDQTVQLQMQRA